MSWHKNEIQVLLSKNKALLQHSYSHLFIYYDRFQATVGKLSNYDTDSVARWA